VIAKSIKLESKSVRIVKTLATNNLKRSIKVECLMIPANVLKIYMKITFTNITIENFTISEKK
jgi:hypothetical protein